MGKENIKAIYCHPAFLTSMQNESGSVMADSLQPHGLSMEFSSQNTGVGSLSLLQGIFLTQELNPGLLHSRQISLPAELQGKPLSEKNQQTWRHVNWDYHNVRTRKKRMKENEQFQRPSGCDQGYQCWQVGPERKRQRGRWLILCLWLGHSTQKFSQISL